MFAASKNPRANALECAGVGCMEQANIRQIKNCCTSYAHILKGSKTQISAASKVCHSLHPRTHIAPTTMDKASCLHSLIGMQGAAVILYS